MKLWKGATFAFMLCGAALSILLIRNMATIGQFNLKTKYSSSSASRQSSSSKSLSKTSLPSPSSSSSSTSSAELTVLSRPMGGLHRRTRSTDEVNSILSEFSMMFQSFTEGEFQHVVGKLLDRKRQGRRLSQSQTRRTKRARSPKSCVLKKLEVTVSELGLGYESDETVMLHYCSGKCTEHRHNYDITMDYMMRTRFKRGRKVSKGPCCRPIAFEKDFSFLDNRSRYHTIQNVSAKNCGCV
ncbi:neurturin [Scomber japonicus]|uniref:neurturin n=1 Tax=Scomber japonicus TaxID=13676 RepID=UPI002304EB87|nr:neurturin [Scomber japonicus]